MATVAKLATGVRAADIPERQHTARLGATLANGAVVKFDTTNGTFVAADATTAAVPIMILLEGGFAGESRTAVERGKLAGFDVASKSFGTRLHAGAGGTVDDGAGAQNTNIMTVIPAPNVGTTVHEKIVQVG